MNKDLLGYISLLFTVATYVPYMWSTHKGNTKPHVFSWAIWALVMAIAAAGQYADAGGPGYWATAGSAAFCFLIALQSLKYGEKNITRFDTVLFVGALAAIPIWHATSAPLSAIIIVSLIDAVAYLPTFRKAYFRPREEMPVSYFISNLKHIIAFFALTNYTLTTILYPAVLIFMNFVLIAMIYLQRHNPAFLRVFSGKERLS